MKLTLKLKEVKEKTMALSAMEGLRIPPSLSLLMAHNLKKLKDETERAEDERIKLCKTYADKDENGEPVKEESIEQGIHIERYKISPENNGLLKEEIKALDETEVELELQEIPKELIDKCENEERYDIPPMAAIGAMSCMLKD